MTHPFLRLAALATVLTLGACSAPLTPAVESIGDLTVRSGQPGTRSLLPNLGTLTYDLTMAGPASAVVSVAGDTDGIFPLKNLALGTWTATIDIKSAGTLIATGTAAKTIGPTSSGILDVPMTYVYGSGTVTPVLNVDASASPYPILAASVLWDATPLAAAFDTSTLSVGVNPGSQPVGTHTLAVTFYRDSKKTLPVGFFQTVLVCLAGGSFANITLGANDFHAPGAPEMVQVPGGTFTFGMAQATVSSFLIGKYPVTQAQFLAVMGFNPSDYNNISQTNPEATWSPVESVSWYDAVEFANRLSLAEGLQPVYGLSQVTRVNDHITLATVVTDLSRNGYRLPTEAEYEYATRAGTTSGSFWGGADGADYAWGTYNTGSPLTRTQGVGQKLPNAWGLYDMVGNVWEWLNDFSATQPTVATMDYAGPANGTEKLYRGGGFLNSSATVPTLNDAFLSGFRGLDDPPEATMSDVGFRVVRRALSPSLASVGSIPVTTLDSGYGRFLSVAADQQHPGKFLVSGVSGTLNNTGLKPWGTNLMARFNADATLDSSFGNNTDAALTAARFPYGPVATFSPLNQTNVVQPAFLGGTGESYFSGFAQNAFGLYVFQPSVAGGWNHSEVYRYDPNGVLDVGYSQPVYTPHTENFMPFIVYAQFLALSPPVVDSTGIMYSAGFDALTGYMALNRTAANGDYPWQNDPANSNNRYYQSTFPIASFTPYRSVLQADNKLLVVGNNELLETEGKLIRIDLGASNGTLDTGFASGGTFAFNNDNADGSQRHYSSVKVWNGKIYLTGWDYLPTTSPPGVGGFVQILGFDGALETTSVLPHPFDRPADLAIGPFGDVVVVGTTATSPARAFAYRLSSNGSNGTIAAALAEPGYGSGALSVAIDGANNVAVVGYTNKPGWANDRETVPAFWRF